MILNDYIEDLKLELTGGVTKLEIPDETIAKVINKSMRELNRYINETKLITVPFARCIDLTDFKCSSITNVYRTNGTGMASDIQDTSTTEAHQVGISAVDPLQAQQWAMYSGGGGIGVYNLNNWILNYSSYNVAQQIQNTISTDLTFKHDKHDNKLYINVLDVPNQITIEYVPVFEDVDEIKSDYWQDILLRLSVAETKVILGRIRSKYKASNALWEVDGDTILEEGRAELTELRTTLSTNSQITYTLD